MPAKILRAFFFKVYYLTNLIVSWPRFYHLKYHENLCRNDQEVVLKEMVKMAPSLTSLSTLIFPPKAVT